MHDHNHDKNRGAQHSCCGYDHETFSPEAHARRQFLKTVGLAATAFGVGGLVGGAPALAQAPGGASAQLAQAPAAQAPVREITQIAGNLYRFRNNFHFSAFVVTPQGIIMGDTVNAAAANWLKAELQQRFGQPVRYLVYSHDHSDHIGGGEVFQDTAVIVAHDRCRDKIVGEKRPTPPPTVTFSDRMKIHLGGTTVDLIHVGRNHSDNTLLMHFGAQRAIFTVDWIPIESLAFRDFTDGFVDEWIEGLKRVEAMDFDILMPGHGPVGRKEHVRMFRQYMEELYAGVLQGVREGKSAADMVAAMPLEKYRSWGGYEQMRALNIQGMHRYITVFRVPNI